MLDFLSPELTHAIGWTFIHSLWQGAMIALFMILLLQRIPTRNAQLRYTVAMSCLAGMFFAALATFFLLYFEPAQPGHSAAVNAIYANSSSTGTAVGPGAWISRQLPLLVTVWMAGILILAARLGYGLYFVRRMRLSAQPLGSSILDKATNIASGLGLRKSIHVAESRLVNIPVVIGMLKPIVLFPVGAVNQLTTDEVEAVLAHEIAHLVRNDFLHNLVQSFIEIVFYYHPAVWWISAVARDERERCCDDIALSVCNNQLTYAKALVRLQEVGRTPALALPFAASKKRMLNRIRRILNQPQSKSHTMEKIAATTMLLLFMLLSAFRSEPPVKASDNIRVVDDIAVLMGMPACDTVPAKTTTKITESVDGEEISITITNGEIIQFSRNGEEIPESEYDLYSDEIDRLQAQSMRVPSPPEPPVPVPAPDAPVPPGINEAPDAPAPPPAPQVQKYRWREKNVEKRGATKEKVDGNDNAALLFGDREYEVAVMKRLGSGGAEPCITTMKVQTTKSRKESVILREDDGNGGYTYRLTGENAGESNIEIDQEKGVALLDGEEIILNADSVFVIEEIKTTPDYNVRSLTFPDGNDKFEFDVDWDFDSSAPNIQGARFDSLAKGVFVIAGQSDSLSTNVRGYRLQNGAGANGGKWIIRADSINTEEVIILELENSDDPQKDGSFIEKGESKELVWGTARMQRQEVEKAMTAARQALVNSELQVSGGPGCAKPQTTEALVFLKSKPTADRARSLVEKMIRDELFEQGEQVRITRQGKALSINGVELSADEAKPYIEDFNRLTEADIEFDGQIVVPGRKN